jgi:hypothetical protein
MTIKLIKDEITADLARIQRELQLYPQEVLTKLKSETPVKSGRARRSTTLENNKLIRLDYPYFDKLNHGSSKQAKDGMTNPLDKWVVLRVKKIFGK